MLTGKTIALFIDLDNASLQKEHYDNIIEQVAKMGDIVIGKVYGAYERKHKKILVDATNAGFDIKLPMRVKKRNSKVFDSRIACDAVEAILTNNQLDAVAVIAGGGDLVYFYRLLKKYGIKISHRIRYLAIEGESFKIVIGKLSSLFPLKVILGIGFLTLSFDISVGYFNTKVR